MIIHFLLAARLRAAALAACAIACMPAHSLEVGQSAPDFTLAGRPGAPAIKLSDLRGKTVYLDFWASWCGPCKQSFPWMNAMQARFANRGLHIVAVNLDQKGADAAAFLAEVPAKFDIAFDAEAKTPRAFGVIGMPTSVLIGPDGKILMIHSGFTAAQADGLERQIQLTLNRKDQ
jgi:cytochrome c biogenesis protein CcmG/thiol:disulfide interchange protein DsbE